MMLLKDYLEERISEGAKIAVVGAGSVLKGDDAAGMLLIEELEKDLNDLPHVLLVAGSTAPENFTGLIKDFGPDYIFIVDAAHLEEKPGAIGVIEEEHIGGLSFSTHMLPFPIMIDYLRREIGCPTGIIGIQPASTETGVPMDEAVLAAVEELRQAFVQCLKPREEKAS